MLDLGPEELSPNHLAEFIALWNKLQTVNQLPDTPDQIIWKLSPNGLYSSSSAYQAQFLGTTVSTFHEFALQTA